MWFLFCFCHRCFSFELCWVSRRYQNQIQIYINQFIFCVRLSSNHKNEIENLVTHSIQVRTELNWVTFYIIWRIFTLKKIKLRLICIYEEYLDFKNARSTIWLCILKGVRRIYVCGWRVLVCVSVWGVKWVRVLWCVCMSMERELCKEFILGQ